MTAPRIVLDTNVLISSIGRKSPHRWIFDSIIEGDVVLCISNEILFEYREVLARRTTETIADNISQFLTNSGHVEKIAIFFNFNLIEHDQSDNKFVDCAIAANADCIVSNDKHFRVLSSIPFPKIRVFSLDEFGDSYCTNR